MVADTIRNEYYYDESAGIRQCLTKVLGVANKRLAHQRDKYGLAPGGRRRGPGRRGGGGRPRPRALRRHRRSGRGLPHPPGPPLHPARPEPGARAPRRRPGAGGLARRAPGGRLAQPRLGQRDGQDRVRRPQGRPRHAPPAVGDRASPRAVRGRGRQGVGRRVRLRGQRGGGHLQGPVARAGPPGRAPRRRTRQGPHPAGRLRRRRRRRRGRRGRQGTRRGRQRLRALRLADPGHAAATQARIAQGHGGDEPHGDPATRGRRRPRLHRRGRRARPGRVRRSQASSRPPSHSGAFPWPSGPSRRRRRPLRASPDPAWT